MKTKDTPRSALHCRPQKSFSAAQAMENTRDWEQSMYDTKNLDKHHHYDYSRKKLNFCIIDGKIRSLEELSSGQLMEKLHRRLAELHFNADNKLDQNAVVDWVFSGDHERMNEMAFGKAATEIDFSKNADNSGIQRIDEIERYAQDANNFACKKFGKENVIGVMVHLDETTAHIHLLVLPVAMRKARGRKTAVYVNLNDPEKKINSKEYRNLSSVKRKEWERTEELEKECVERVSYSGLLGETPEERSKWLENFHTEFYEAVGKKYGLERGQSWEELDEDEKNNRRWKNARQLDNERLAAENRMKRLQDKVSELMTEEQNLKKKVGWGAKLSAFLGVGELAEIREELRLLKKEQQEDKEVARKEKEALIKEAEKTLAEEKEKSRQEATKETLCSLLSSAGVKWNGEPTAEAVGKQYGIHRKNSIEKGKELTELQEKNEKLRKEYTKLDKKLSEAREEAARADNEKFSARSRADRLQREIQDKQDGYFFKFWRLFVALAHQSSNVLEDKKEPEKLAQWVAELWNTTKDLGDWLKELRLKSLKDLKEKFRELQNTAKRTVEAEKLQAENKTLKLNLAEANENSTYWKNKYQENSKLIGELNQRLAKLMPESENIEEIEEEEEISWGFHR